MLLYEQRFRRFKCRRRNVSLRTFPCAVTFPQIRPNIVERALQSACPSFRSREVEVGTFEGNTVARNQRGGILVRRGRISHLEYNSIQDNHGPGVVVESEGFVSYDKGNSIALNGGPARVVARHGEEVEAADRDGLRCWGNKGDAAKARPAGWPPTPWCAFFLGSPRGCGCSLRPVFFVAHRFPRAGSATTTKLGATMPF